jgi:hypothetical protein
MAKIVQPQAPIVIASGSGSRSQVVQRGSLGAGNTSSPVGFPPPTPSRFTGPINASGLISQRTTPTRARQANGVVRRSQLGVPGTQ